MHEEELAVSGVVRRRSETIVAVAQSLPRSNGNADVVEVKLLGRFTVTLGGRSVGPWPRPSARRLCQVLLVSPGRRVSRVSACEALFPSLSPEAAARQLYRVQSMARQALRELGPQASRLLCADSSQIWADPSVVLAVDLDAHEEALRAALRASPGNGRDAALVGALATRGVPLEDEPEAEWAATVRERVEYLRQEARLELARDRLRGVGRAHPEDVAQAWQDCFAADPSDEEAASALMRLYVAQGRRPLAIQAYERCSSALFSLGLTTSSALEQARMAVDGPTQSARGAPALAGDRGSAQREEERRLVTVAFVELSPVGLVAQSDPEDLREVIGTGLAQAISEVEALGGAVMSVSGTIMSALFGAPRAHEDDPERALRSALRIAAALSNAPGGDGRGPVKPSGGRYTGMELSVRLGVETGAAIAGPVGSGGQVGYSAVGAVVGAAAALQSVARPGSVLVGPATHAATDGIFEWGPSQDVFVTPGAQPLTATYLVQPKARSVAEVGRRRLAARAPLVGRDAEMALLTESVRGSLSGHGGAVVIAGEPGLGKTRLVGECRNYFMGWVGAASGRLPLWLEGRCASYASSTPYGAYQQLLSRFIGAPLEAGEAVVRPALEAAMRAVLGKDKQPVALLARMLGLPAVPGEAHVARLGPAELQHEIFSAARSVIGRLVKRGPTVLALEDLHWSDPTSLRLTAELAKLAATGPLLVLATRRPEPDPGVGELELALAADPARPLQVLQLTPVQEADERTLARSLLGGQVSDDVLEAVCQGVEGNPLFLEERLASLLDSGAIQRSPAGWQLGSGNASAIPEALERLVRSRADRLSPAARRAIVAASVIGEEAESSTIRAVSELGAELDGGLSELVSAGLLTEARRQPEPLYRFRHALIRDATYHGLLRSQRRQLHARAAWFMETNAADRLDEVAAVLGHHFAAAGEEDRALSYFELAGDQADRVYAEQRGDRLVPSGAVGHRRNARRDRGAPHSGGVPAIGDGGKDLREARRRPEVDRPVRRSPGGRAAWAGLGPPEDIQQAARLQHLLGAIEAEQGQFDRALAAFVAAEELIAVPTPHADQEWVDLWLVLQLGEPGMPSERNAALIESVRPLVEARASPQVVFRFHQALAFQHLRERRWRVDEQILDELQRAVEAAWSPAPPTLTFLRPERSRFNAMSRLGIALTWHGDLVEARRALEESLAIGERQGTPGVPLEPVRGVILVELAIASLREGDVEAVRAVLPEARAAAATRAGPLPPGPRDGAAGLGGVARRALRRGTFARCPGTRALAVKLRVPPLLPGSLAAGRSLPGHRADRTSRRRRTAVVGTHTGSAARRARGRCSGGV